MTSESHPAASAAIPVLSALLATFDAAVRDGRVARGSSVQIDERAGLFTAALFQPGVEPVTLAR